MVRLAGLGRIHDLKWTPGLGELGRHVGIYGENGVGKTTLVAALRAAGQRSAEPINEHRTLEPRIEPAIELRLSDGVLRYASGSWHGPSVQIWVFDRAYVETHVHQGPLVGPDQRHALYRVALGAGEVDAAKRVDEARQAQAARKGELTAIERRLTQIANVRGLSLDAFAALEPLSEATPELFEARHRLNALDQRPDFGALAEIAQLPAIPREVDAAGLARLLDESAAAIHAVASERVRAHLASLGPTGEGWIRDGVALAEHRSECPFCDRPLGSSELPVLYRLYFDAQYHELLARLDRALSRVTAWEAWLSQVQTIASDNDNARLVWEKFLELEPAPDLKALVAAVTAMVGDLRALFQTKRDHPLTSLGSDMRVAAVAAAASRVSAPHRAYQGWASTQAERCRGLATDSTVERKRLRAQVDLARACIDRHKASNELRALDETRRFANDATQAYEQAQAELERRQAARTAAFTAQLNQVLRDFGARFSITGLEGKESASRVTADFAIRLLDGGSVKASTARQNAPRFATILSEGDKTTLALAVFVAQCRSDPEPNRILVFDDPLTSLDTGRRAMTRHTIDRLASGCAQVWVLSHDPYFLRDCYQSNRQASLLHLRYNDAGATLAPWDPEEACRTEYFRRLAALEAFVSGAPGAPDPDTALQKLRPVLEAYLRFRFPKHWHRNEWLGDFLRRADTTPLPLTLDQVERLRTWCQFTSPSMHDDPGDAAPPPSPDDIRTVARAVLEFVQG